MRKTSILVISLLAGVTWGQHRERKVVRLPPPGSPASSEAIYTPSVRGKKEPAAARDAAAVPQAPGVVQINLSDTQRSAWFVVTDTIPAGAQLVAYISTASNDPNGFLKLGPITYNQDIAPGTSLLLPSISSFGDFWPAGVTTYDVVVNIGGLNTHNAADFAVGAARSYTDLTTPQPLTPIITSWSEGISNRQLILTINGSFTSDPVKVVLTDLVAPRSAIKQSGNTITVNLSQIAGTRLDTYEDFLLTVGQAGFSDTRTFTHVPFDPAAYDASPSLE